MNLDRDKRGDKMNQYCSNCGNKIEQTDSFCANCGCKIPREDYTSSFDNNTFLESQGTDNKSSTVKRIAIIVAGILAVIILCVVISIVFFLVKKDTAVSVSEQEVEPVQNEITTQEGSEEDSQKIEDILTESKEISEETAGYDTPVEYIGKMGMTEFENLQTTIRQVFEWQDYDDSNGISGSWGGEELLGAGLTYDVNTPIFENDAVKTHFVYDILNETYFYNNGQMTPDGMRISTKELNQFLKELVNVEIEEPESLGSILTYNNGIYTYAGSDAGEGVSSKCRIDNIMQISDEQVEIYGEVYYTNVLIQNEVYSSEYPELIESADYYVCPYLSAHSIKALGEINPNSPSGITLLGIEYDADNPYGEAALGDDDFVITKSSVELLTEQDLQKLSKEELRLARNEIYARHGRQFTSKDLQEYFEQYYWYYNTYKDSGDVSDEDLNEIELKNVYFISEYENKL